MRRAVLTRRALAAPVDLGAAVAPLLLGARRVASYVGTGSEPFVTPEIGWLLPVLLEDGQLDWSAFDGTLAAGPRGVHEPTGDRLGVEALAGCDLVLVPALLVDRTGCRLGRGGGSYDRALVHAPGLTVALVLDDELVEEVPCEAHDVTVRAVATPSRGIVHLPTTWAPGEELPAQ